MSRIDGYQFGRVLVDGHEETRDVIVLPHRVVRNWWRKDGHSLAIEDFESVLDELPERLVVGTGASGQMRPASDTIDFLKKRGIHVDVRKTDEAVRLFAELDPATTAAALHLTC